MQGSYNNFGKLWLIQELGYGAVLPQKSIIVFEIVLVIQVITIFRWGAIAYPISETMMSINLIDVFNCIKDISAETINTGSSIYPYIQIGEAAISRK